MNVKRTCLHFGFYIQLYLKDLMRLKPNPHININIESCALFNEKSYVITNRRPAYRYISSDAWTRIFTKYLHPFFSCFLFFIFIVFFLLYYVKLFIVWLWPICKPGYRRRSASFCLI